MKLAKKKKKRSKTEGANLYLMIYKEWNQSFEINPGGQNRQKYNILMQYYSCMAECETVTLHLYAIWAKRNTVLAQWVTGQAVYFLST